MKLYVYPQTAIQIQERGTVMQSSVSVPSRCNWHRPVVLHDTPACCTETLLPLRVSPPAGVVGDYSHAAAYEHPRTSV